MAIQLPEKPWSEGDSFIVEDTGLEYTFNGEVWVSPRGTVEFPAPVYMGDDEPENPEEGDLWYDTNRLEMFIYYHDGENGAWVTTTALGARVAEGEARQREIEKELAFTRTRLVPAG